MAKLKKLEASALIETLVAISIIIISVSLTFSLLFQESGFVANSIKITAMKYSEKYGLESIQNHEFFNDEKVVGGITLKRRCSFVQSADEVIRIEILALDNNQDSIISTRWLCAVK